MPADVTDHQNAVAFPELDDTDLAAIKALATPCSFEYGELVFRAGEPAAQHGADELNR